MESSFLTRDQSLSLWSGSTDCKTLDYQRINPREYQIVRTHKKETTWTQDLALLNHSSTLCRKPHLNNNKTKMQTQSLADRITTSLSLAHQKKNKQQQQQQKSPQISAYTKPTQPTGPPLGAQKPKGRNNLTWSLGKKISNTIS